MAKYIYMLWTFLVISLASVTAGCSDSNLQHPAVSAGETTISITDSLGRQITLPYPVKRAAVSNAYNAELITAIGASEQIVGVDYYIYQDQEGFGHRFKESQLIGESQRELNYEKIIQLNPEVLILTGNGGWEEAEKKLKPFGIAVVVCDSYYTDQFFKSANMLGQIFGKEKEAKELTDYFSEKLDYIDQHLKNIPAKSVYFEYRAPGKTTIPGDYFYQMVEKAHGKNIFADAKGVQINLEEVVGRNPDYIVKVSDVNVYSSYIPPTTEDMKRILNEIKNRPGWDSINAVKNDHVLLLSHYVHGGASKLVGTMYIAKYLYPEELPELHPEEIFKTWVTKYQKLQYHPGHTYPAFTLED